MYPQPSGDTRGSEGITCVSFITQCYFISVYTIYFFILCGLVGSTNLCQIEANSIHEGLEQGSKTLTGSRGEPR